VLPSEIAELIQHIRSGHRLSLARTISRVEDGGAESHALLAALYPYTGHAHIVGITGAPGTGKSTLVTALAQRYRTAGQSVGIVAVDPTSPFTGGALLGDRVRMRALSGDPGVFVRSMATRGSLGGLSKSTADVVTVLDAAGFERILVETVGVGQAEVEIARTAHTTVVVEAPGFGDEVQALKAGILEIADLLVVNKADLPGVERTVQALEMMLELAHDAPRPLHHHGQWLTLELPPSVVEPATRWPVRVHKTIAASGHGVDALHQRIEEHVTWLRTTGELALRERGRILHTLENILRAAWEERIQSQLAAAGLERLVEAIHQRKSDPYTVAKELMASDKELGFML
jgi:LAO/AO transport system kinase